MEADWPGAIVKPVSEETTANACGETLTALTAAEALPELASVTDIVLLAPTTTFPKLNVEALAVRCAVPATTFNMAGLLIRLPAELLTTATKIEPSSVR